jgi:hypothetical protein
MKRHTITQDDETGKASSDALSQALHAHRPDVARGRCQLAASARMARPHPHRAQLLSGRVCARRFRVQPADKEKRSPESTLLGLVRLSVQIEQQQPHRFDRHTKNSTLFLDSIHEKTLFGFFIGKFKAFFQANKPLRKKAARAERLFQSIYFYCSLSVV